MGARSSVRRAFLPDRQTERGGCSRPPVPSVAPGTRDMRSSSQRRRCRSQSDRLLHADLVHLMGSIRLQQDAGISELELVRELEVEGLDAERKAKLLTLVMEARLYAFDAVGAVALALDAEAAARGADWPFGLTYIASAYLLAGEHERATALYRELAASRIS